MSFFCQSRIAALLCLLSLHGQLLAQPDAPDVPAALTYREAIIGYEPMNLYGLADSRVAGILRDYYAASFGGRKSWEEIESFRFEGILRMPQGAISFVAFKKKPDYCKVVLFGGNDMRIVMSYDGADAWQLNTAESTEPSTMPPLEALNFIRDAPTAGHLHYPTLPGKQVELIGERRVGSHACYDLRATLPDGQQVTYAIDRLSFVERQQITVNPVSGAIEVTTHGRVEQVEGVMMPMESTMTIDGEFIHSVQMRSVEANCGVMPWMFARPSGAYVPGAVPGGAVELEDVWSSDLTGTGQRSDVTDSAFETFGFDEEVTGAFEATRFPDLDAATTQSILDDIGDL